MLVDNFERRITYLRMSVTDRCDLRCVYCMPERMQFLPRAEILTLEELYLLARGFMERGVRQIRLTGGEPLVRRDVIDLIRALGGHVGAELDEVTLTTNGTQLHRFADDLASAGVRRVNVSLDTLDHTVFQQLSRRNQLDQVLRGIAAARAAGLKVKINTVALLGVNDGEIADLVRWAHSEGHDITLIETMPLGVIDGDRRDNFLPLDQVRADLSQSWTLIPSEYVTAGPARYVTVAETGGRIGFITPLSQNFCAGCNRMRVTATGQLYPCLGGGQRVDLRAALRSSDPANQLEKALTTALQIKPRQHNFQIGDDDNEPALARHMSVTGG